MIEHILSCSSSTYSFSGPMHSKIINEIDLEISNLDLSSTNALTFNVAKELNKE